MGMDGRRRNPYELTEDTPVYVISVAAQLSGLHPQTLRQYDRLGLVSPDRTAGRGRRYSARDIELLRQVQQLSQDEGINLAGIKRIIELENQVAALQRVRQLRYAGLERGHGDATAGGGGARLVPPRPGAVPGGPADQRAGGVAAQAAAAGARLTTREGSREGARRFTRTSGPFVCPSCERRVQGPGR
jgi:hypothetical protein